MKTDTEKVLSFLTSTVDYILQLEDTIEILKKRIEEYEQLNKNDIDDLK